MRLICGYCQKDFEAEGGRLPAHLPCGRGEIAPDPRTPAYIGFIERRARALGLGQWKKRDGPESPFEKAT
jgi:hypothetical protein